VHTRKLSIRHRTEFVYASPARESVNEVRLSPVDWPRQSVESVDLDVTPTADVAESFDLYGNRVWWCQIVEGHERLVMEASSVVAIAPARVMPVRDDGAEQWAIINSDGYRDDWAEFLTSTPHVGWTAATREFAEALNVPDGVGVAEWAAALAVSINEALVYEPGATDVTTTVDGVLAAGRGVCQDFANVFLAVCRQRGVAARYVSGWLYEPDREGPVESHAWVEVLVPGAGWVEEDPTHPGEVGDRHVRIAVGRDYGDVVPVKGAYLGGATESMIVEVELVDLTAAIETA